MGAFIRQIDYLNAKDGNDYENSDDNPGNQLIDVENQCKDISFDELKVCFSYTYKLLKKYEDYPKMASQHLYLYRENVSRLEHR